VGTEVLYKSLVGVSPAAVMAVDENMVVKTVSPSAENFLNIKKEKITGRHVKECAFLGQAVLEDLEKNLREGIEHKVTCYLCGAGGEKTAVGLQIRRLLDPDGGILGAALIFEAIPRHSNIERIVNNEKIELIEQMSIGIAHHIRNSLTAVKGFIQVVKERGGGEPGAGITEFSAIALKELDRVNDIIGKLLHLADSSGSKRESVDLAGLLENIYLFIRSKAALSGILVEKNLSPSLPNPRVDVVRIIHALFNITENAIHSMPDGGRLLLHTYVIPAERKICIEISDTGVGIPPENLKKIFNPFFSTREDGMGFGLALANKIIYDHGGEIRVTSEEGKGTTFSVYLPV